jgi:hypothetical protein
VPEKGMDEDHVVGRSIFENRTGRSAFGSRGVRDSVMREFAFGPPRDPLTINGPDRNRPLTRAELKANARSV